MPIHPAYGARVEKETATHSSILAWRIPWTEEPGRLQPMGSQRVEHDRATKQQHGAGRAQGNRKIILT